MDIKCSVSKKPCKRLPLWRLAPGTEFINPVNIPGSTLRIGTVTLGYDKRNYPLFSASPPWFLHPVVLSLCLFRVLQHFVSLNSLNKFMLWIKFGAFFIWETLTYREKVTKGHSQVKVKFVVILGFFNTLEEYQKLNVLIFKLRARRIQVSKYRYKVYTCKLGDPECKVIPLYPYYKIKRKRKF